MSDLQRRNTEAMISETRRMHKEVEELRQMIVSQNAKIASLCGEVAALKQQVVMQAVQRGN